MTDLERFFERLVRNVAAIDQQKVRQPIAVVEIKTSLLPYRTNRRALGLEGTEDYEELLVRLVSGEGGLVTTVPAGCGRLVRPPDVEPVAGPVGHSGPGRRDDHGESGGAGRIFGGRGASLSPTASGGATVGPEKCPHCDVKLPTNRAVNFCPACGRSVTLIPCD